MVPTLTVTVSVEIAAETRKVWKALTDPALIKQYLFGTDVEAEWKVGGAIRWRGVWQEKPYEDKGTVLKFEPERRLSTTYWSSLSGTADAPENYVTVTYDLAPRGTATLLTLQQDGIKNEDGRKHMAENWTMVLNGLKKIVEEM